MAFVTCITMQDVGGMTQHCIDLNDIFFDLGLGRFPQDKTDTHYITVSTAKRLIRSSRSTLKEALLGHIESLEDNLE
jgi:hypothetical protein